MMALSPISPLSIKSLSSSSSNLKVPYTLQSLAKPFVIVNQTDSKKNSFRDYAETRHSAESKKWSKLVSTALAAAIVTVSWSALADLNKFEANIRGEFGIGSAAQFGSADLRRANFTAADLRESDFSGSTFNGAYLEKAVAYKSRVRIRLGGALIEGADFSDAVLDLQQKQVLYKYANGTNPITGASIGVSLGTCGNSRRNAYGTPSSPLLSAPPKKLLDRDGFCDEATGHCDAK